MEKNREELCKSILHLPYDLRSLKMLKSFISDTLDITTITPNDKDNFFLAAEEVFSFVLFNHISPSEDELIKVQFSFSSDSEVEYEFQYMGTPIRPDEIATFEKENVSDDNLDKLWYYLVESIMDKVEFINLGNDGWQIKFSKKIDGAFYTRQLPEDLQAEETIRKDISDVNYRLSIPSDANALVELTHKTYAYTFAEPEFYFSEHLASAIEEKSIVSIVGELNGEILGHVGLAYHSTYPDSAEIGMLMVNPEYQRTRLTFVLSKKFQELIINKKEYQKNIFTTVSTTAHKASQHMIIKLAQLYPIMLMISACPKADYDKNSPQNIAKREALVFGIQLLYQSATTIYLPKIHHDIMAPLFEQLNANITLSCQEEEENSLETKISIERFDLSYSANIIIESCSNSWTETIRKNIYALRSEGIKTINIMIPAWKPLPQDIREKMKLLNAFFVGTPIFTKDKWYIAYVALDSEIVNFDEIEIYNPAAQDLLYHIEDEYDYVLNNSTIGVIEE